MKELKHDVNIESNLVEEVSRNESRKHNEHIGKIRRNMR
jgi:hypothetical protein